jgi:hypothetical protein
MAVRNFWIDADIEGRQTILSGGPRAKDGGMEVTLYQRNDGSIEKVLRIVCRACGDELVTDIYIDRDRLCHETKR